MAFETNDIVVFLSIITVLIGCARIAGAVCRRYGIPSVIGELGAGIIVGPSIFSRVNPELYDTIFTNSPEASLALSALLTLCSVILLFIVGLEIKVSAMKTEKRAIFAFGISGVLIPLLVGVGVGYYFIDQVPEGVTQTGFIGVIAAAFAVSALPVIARILLDLNFLASRIGGIIIGSAAVNDIAGWLVFIFALGIAGTLHAAVPVWVAAVCALLISVLAVTWLPRVLDVVMRTVARYSNTGTAQGIVVLPLLFGLAAFTEYVGLHALFGAFALGVALSESHEFHGALRDSLETLNMAFFAPLYFVAVGLKADFLAGFDGGLIVTVFVLAFLAKLLAARIAGALVGFSNNESMAVGFGLAARGGMGIILASVAYGAGVIGLPMFEALIVMAVLTSFLAACIPHFLRTGPA